MTTVLTGLLLLVTTAGSTSALDEQRFVERVLSAGLASREVEAEAALERAQSSGAGLWPNPSLGWEREGAAQAPAQDKLTASVPLVVSGRLGLERESADLRRQAAEARRSRARALLRRRAIGAFAAARAAQERARILEGSRAALSELTRAIAAREKAGDAAGYERLRIELEGATVDSALRDAQLDRSRAEAAARLLLGPGTAPLPALAGELAPPRELPPLAALDAGLEPRRSDLRALALDADAATRARSAASRSWVPDPVIGGGALLAGGGAGYTATLTVPLPLLQHGQREGAVASAEETLARTRRALALEEARSTLDVDHGAALARREQLERHRREVVTRARELRQTAGAAYRGGGADLLILVDAERALREAQLREVELATLTTAAEADLLLLAGLLDADPAGGTSR